MSFPSTLFAYMQSMNIPCSEMWVWLHGRPPREMSLFFLGMLGFIGCYGAIIQMGIVLWESRSRE